MSVLAKWDRRDRLETRAIPGLEAVGLIAPSGERFAGGAALAPLLRQLPGGRMPARLLARFPGLAERGYAWVAAHRSELARVGLRRRRAAR